jgi:hypothetical protein
MPERAGRDIGYAVSDNAARWFAHADDGWQAATGPMIEPRLGLASTRASVPHPTFDPRTHGQLQKPEQL